MAKPQNNGNEMKSASYTQKTYALSATYTYDQNDSSVLLSSDFSVAKGSGTPGLIGETGLSLSKSNDFVYVGNTVKLDIAGPSIDGLDGADQLIFSSKLNADDATINDVFFSHITSFESVKLGDVGYTIALGDDSFAAGIRDVAGGSSADTISFSTAYDAAAVRVDGGAGDDVIAAAGGNDTINGGAGNDSIDGGAGNDLVVGGNGQDAIDAGSGADRISLVGIATVADADTIYNFTTASDQIVLTNTTTLVAGTAATALVDVADIGGLAESDILIGTADAVTATDAHAVFVHGGYAYASDTGALYFDADGDFRDGAVIVGTLYSSASGGANTVATVAASDFVFGLA